MQEVCLLGEWVSEGPCRSGDLREADRQEGEEKQEGKEAREQKERQRQETVQSASWPRQTPLQGAHVERLLARGDDVTALVAEAGSCCGRRNSHTRSLFLQGKALYCLSCVLSLVYNLFF